MAKKVDGRRNNGGKREGAGRPFGSKNIYSYDAVKKLEELGFDPIEKMIEQYTKITTELEDGTIRKGSGAYSQMTATLQKITNDLMQYGYKRIPDKQEIEFSKSTPIMIKLTDDEESD